jgi:ABC-2 type transport system ATP-binding protein
LQVVQFEAVSKEFPGHCALNQVSFSLQQKQIHGLLGPNGAGKSTLMNILAGILPASSGKIYWPNGALSIGFLPEHSPLYGGMRVEEYLYFAAKLKEVVAEIEVQRVLDICQLGDLKHRLIQNLSRGYRQRVNLAQALLNRPKLLILDEPFIGLDPQSITELRHLFISLKNETTILFSSHQLQEVESICDELTILHKGNLLATGSLESILRSVDGSEAFTIKIKPDNKDWQKLILELHDIASVELIDRSDKYLKFSIKSDQSEKSRALVVNEVVKHGGSLLELRVIERHLEDVFEKMIKEVKDGGL